MLDLARIRQLRERQGLTQEDAARQAGLAGRAKWNDIESGRKANVTIKTLGAIARALECRPADLLVDEPPVKREAEVIPENAILPRLATVASRHKNP